MTVAEPRFATLRTPERRTLGAAAGRVARALGCELMDWQRGVLDVALEVGADNRLVYRDVTITVPRQQGKSTLLMVLWVSRCLLWPDQRVAYCAQTGSDARKKWQNEWLPTLAKSPFADLLTINRSSGHERVMFDNGSRQQLVATTAKAGHGDSLDLAVLDEAFAHGDARLEQALRPAMITRPQPQFWVVSTAGTPDGSPYLLDRVNRGREIARSGVRDGVAYFEWSADDDQDPANPATWRSCMPALGKTVTERAVRADFEAMDGHEFKRAFLNMWTGAKNAPVIPIEVWNGLEDPASRPLGRFSVGVDISVDRDHACIACAGKRADGRWHVGILEYHPGRDWVEETLARLVADRSPASVVIDSLSPTDGLQRALSARADRRVYRTSASEMAEAAAGFYDAVIAGDVQHTGPRELAVAIDGAARRSLGDRWAWSRRRSGTDISPLVAATLALFGAQRIQKPRARVIDPHEALYGPTESVAGVTA